MRIMLEVLGIPPYGGARTAAIEWVTALAEFKTDYQFIVLVNKREDEFELLSNIKQYIVSTPGRLLPRVQLQFLIPLMVKRYDIDIVHFMRNLAVIVPNAKVIVNINDLTRLIFPDMFSHWDILYWEIIQSRILRSADRIICISNQTRSDMINWLDYPEDHVITVFPAIKKSFFPIDKVVSESTLRKYDLPKQFFLYVGGLAEHKNIRTLIKAFAQVKQSTPIPHGLVIVGGQYHTHNDKNLEEIAKNVLGDEVIFTGTVSDEDLILLYNAAEAFVFPSLYEGFGLAPLEAMACGTPVIASQVGSLPEVLGQAAYWVDDPLDEQAYANAINEIIKNQSLRTKLAQQGLAQVKKFSWAETAKQTVNVYQNLMAENA